MTFIEGCPHVRGGPCERFHCISLDVHHEGVCASESDIGARGHVPPPPPPPILTPMYQALCNAYLLDLNSVGPQANVYRGVRVLQAFL